MLDAQFYIQLNRQRLRRRVYGKGWSARSAGASFGGQIRMLPRLKPLGKGTLRLSHAALVFEEGNRQASGEERMGPHGAVEFKVEGDSPVRWEDYVSAARGATIRQWKVKETRESRSKHLKASGAGPDVSHWRHRDGFS
jgi:hypothetical protein